MVANTALVTNTALFANTALLANNVRSTLRLFKILAKTAWFGGSLGLRAALHGVDPERSAAVSNHWGRSLLRTLGVQVQVYGKCPDDATILVGNHRSYLDIPLVVAARPCAFLAKHELASWPLLGQCARAAGTVFVKRGNKESQNAARRALQRRAERGETVALFPEGTTFAGPGMLPMRTGAFRIAAEAGVTVAPVAIVYSNRGAAYVLGDSFISHFLRLFRARRLQAHVSFGPSYTDSNSQHLHSQIQAWMSSEVARLEQLTSAEPNAD